MLLPSLVTPSPPMSFIPHTEQDVAEMLARIGVFTLDALFDEIPAGLPAADLSSLPAALSEMALSRLMHERAEADGQYLNFIGAGAYEHHIPAAVSQLIGRGELYSAYTPYQAEASQGTLQIIYEYQSMMTGLTGLEVSNASLYDGATALAEAILMAVRASRADARRILLPASVHPRYRAVAAATVSMQGIELVSVPFDPNSGQTRLDALDTLDGPTAALVIPQPNYFGVIEPVDALTDWAHAHGTRVIAVVNPTSLALLKPPGQWGAAGADLCVGDGQPLGVPLSSGGPYFGFMTCRESLVRQMPGRIVGRTVDRQGKPGFVLTLQAREQHIRRAKATSNICSNQGLMMVAATVYLALLGPQGLIEVARAAHANTRALVERLTAIDGVRRRFSAPFFHEAALTLDRPVNEVLRALRAQGILGGYPLGTDYPGLEDSLLVCATETKTASDLDRYAQQLQRILSRRREAPPCAYKS